MIDQSENKEIVDGIELIGEKQKYINGLNELEDKHNYNDHDLTKE